AIGACSVGFSWCFPSRGQNYVTRMQWKLPAPRQIHLRDNNALLTEEKRRITIIWEVNSVKLFVISHFSFSYSYEWGCLKRFSKLKNASLREAQRRSNLRF